MSRAQPRCSDVHHCHVEREVVGKLDKEIGLPELGYLWHYQCKTSAALPVSVHGAGPLSPSALEIIPVKYALRKRSE